MTIRVLLVEDLEIKRRAWRRVLHSAGAHVVAEAGALSEIPLVQPELLDAVVTDLELPEQPGEAPRASTGWGIVELARAAGLPVLVISSLDPPRGWRERTCERWTEGDARAEVRWLMAQPHLAAASRLGYAVHWVRFGWRHSRGGDTRMQRRARRESIRESVRYLRDLRKRYPGVLPELPGTCGDTGTLETRHLWGPGGPDVYGCTCELCVQDVMEGLSDECASAAFHPTEEEAR